MFPPPKKPPQLPKLSADHVPGDSPQPFRSPVNQQRGISPHYAASAQQPRGVSPSYAASPNSQQQRGLSPSYAAASPQLYAMSSPVGSSPSLTPLSGPLPSPSPPPPMPPSYIAKQTYTSPHMYTPQYSGQRAVHAPPVHHASVISRSYPPAAAAAPNPPSPPPAPQQPASFTVASPPTQTKTISLNLPAPMGEYTVQYSSPSPSPTPSDRGDGSGGVGAHGGASSDPYPATETPAGEEEEPLVDDEPELPVDPTDLLARLCSREKIKADDLDFWKKVMDGMEWLFYETEPEQSQVLLQQYCKSFVRNAARSRNFHALLLVICRHLENYSQTLHGLAGSGASGEAGQLNHLAVPSAATSSSTSSSSSVSVPPGSLTGSSAAALAVSLSKDHWWVTQLLYFLRLMLQYVLSHLSYDETLLFFQHLAIPDIASKPGTPKAPSTTRGSGTTTPTTSAPPAAVGDRIVYGNEGNWTTSTEPSTTSGNTLSPPPMKHHTINLNPNSRRSSVNPTTSSSAAGNVDILTRFVCAIVNQLEVLGDALLNAQLSTGKSGARASRGSISSASPKLGPATSPIAHHRTSQPLVDLHLELLSTFFVMLSTQMYLPLSTDYEQVFLDRLMYCCKPPMLNSTQGFMTSLVQNFTEILPADWATTLAKKQQAEKPKSFFSKLTSSLTTLLYFPVWAVRYLFTIAPNHPAMDRSTLLIELLVYQNNENDFRTAIRKLRNADRPRPPQTLYEAAATSPSASRAPLPLVGGSDYSSNTLLENLELGAVSFDKLYYALCSTLLSEHVNLFLYSLIHENAHFRAYLLHHHQHDLDYLLMPMLEILYREVDISKHHVYMIINIWILLTQQQGFDQIIKGIRIREVPFFKEMVLRDLALTQVMQIVLLRTLQLNLRTKLKEPHIFNNCMPEEDHQVLTEHGFMFLAQLQEALRRQPQLRIACYDEASKQLQYHPITAGDLVVKDGVHRMVDVISTPDVIEKRNSKGCAEPTHHSNHVTLSVTADHDLYLRYSQKTVGRQTGGFHKVQAGDLLTTDFPRFKMLAAATGGVEQQPEGQAAAASAPFVSALGLTQSWHVDAFLELYGYWLGDGTLSFIHAAIVFSPTKEADDLYLDRWLAALPLHQLESGGVGQRGYWRQPNRTGGRRIYMIYHPAWWSFFSGEYLRKYVHAGRDYAKALTKRPGPLVPPPPVAAQLSALPAMAAPSPSAPSVSSAFDCVVQLAGPLAAGRPIQAPFAHMLLGTDISNTAPVGDSRVRVMLNLLNPVHPHFGADQTGQDWSVAFRLINLALLSGGVMPANGAAGFAITELNPLVSIPSESAAMGSSQEYSPIWQASMEATLRTGAQVVIAAGEHVQARWRETPLLVDRVPLQLPGVQTACYSARSTLDGAAVLVVSSQHPSALDDSTLPSITAALVLAHALLRADGAQLSAAALQEIASFEQVVNTVPSFKSSKWFWSWVWRRGVLQPNQLRSIIRGLRLADGDQSGAVLSSDDDDASSEDDEAGAGDAAAHVEGVKVAPGIHQGGTLFTSSALFRDELMIVLLHAGYAAYFTQTHATGSSHGTNKNGALIVARSANWTICYSDQPRATEPNMSVGRDVRERELHGRVWCVTVPHKDHLIVVRRAHTDASGLVVEASTPVVIGNCLAAFCNLTITALLGPPPALPIGSTPNSSPPPTPPTASAPHLGGLLSSPMTLHPQVAFRLTRVLCILSRKFLVLQVHHDQQIVEHNARLERLVREGRDTEDGLTEEEEKEELELEEVAEELGTCMEFIQLLLEVVNHSIVHARPEASPLLPPSQQHQLLLHPSTLNSSTGLPIGFQSSLSTNPHLLYNLIHSQEYFLQLLPYEDLFERHLIRNITNVIVFYANATGVRIQTGEAGQAATAGGKSGARGSSSEKEVAAAVAALTKAIQGTPLSSVSPLSAVSPHPSMPEFDPSALIERGPFTYHEQENSQDFFVPYIFQLLQTMNILPKMYAPGETAASVALSGAHAQGGPMDHVNADEMFMNELTEADEISGVHALQQESGDADEHELADLDADLAAKLQVVTK